MMDILNTSAPLSFESLSEQKNISQERDSSEKIFVQAEDFVHINETEIITQEEISATEVIDEESMDIPWQEVSAVSAIDSTQLLDEPLVTETFEETSMLEDAIAVEETGVLEESEALEETGVLDQINVEADDLSETTMMFYEESVPEEATMVLEDNETTEVFKRMPNYRMLHRELVVHADDVIPFENYRMPEGV